jgi:small conductance mechanosensitive channel
LFSLGNIMNFGIRLIRIVASMALAALFLAGAQAQSQDLPPLESAVKARFDAAIAEIEDQKETVQGLLEKVEGVEGPTAELLTVRSDKLWTSMFHATVELAKDVENEREQGRDVSAYYERVGEELGELPTEAHSAISRLSARIEFPTDKLSPDKFVIRDQQLFKSIGHVDNVYRALIAYFAVAESYGLDTEADLESTKKSVADSAANRSVFLEMAIDDVETLRASAATLPDDAGIANWLKAAQARVRMTADAMNTSIGMMTSLGLSTQSYRQQVLTATGEITTDVLDVSIVAGLVSTWSLALVDLVATDGPRLQFQVLLALLILFVFRQLSKLAQKGVDAALGSARVRVSQLLRRMIVSIVGNLVMIIGVLLAISQFGISLGPLFAGLGIAGFIIGFALQDALGNFASGLMILIYRPFDVGDVIEAGGVSGKVSHMSLVNTTVKTFDNQKMVIPNNLIWKSVITNRTSQQTRRVDLVFGISYDDDVEKAEKVLTEIVAAHESVLDDPPPSVKLHELAESSVNFIVRPWVNTSDYWETYWDITKQVKIRFDEEGISIPFPQRDVHVVEQSSS